MKRREQIQKNVSRPSNPPDELAQNVSKKNPRWTNYSSIFLQKLRIWPFFNYLHDSNSIFWAQGIKSEGVSGGTVQLAQLSYSWCFLFLLHEFRIGYAIFIVS